MNVETVITNIRANIDAKLRAMQYGDFTFDIDVDVRDLRNALVLPLLPFGDDMRCHLTTREMRSCFVAFRHAFAMDAADRIRRRTPNIASDLLTSDGRMPVTADGNAVPVAEFAALVLATLWTWQDDANAECERIAACETWAETASEAALSGWSQGDAKALADRRVGCRPHDHDAWNAHVAKRTA